MLRQYRNVRSSKPENHFVLSTFSYQIQPPFYNLEITVSGIFESGLALVMDADNEITACYVDRQHWPGSGTCFAYACDVLSLIMPISGTRPLKSIIFAFDPGNARVTPRYWSG